MTEFLFDKHLPETLIAMLVLVSLGIAVLIEWLEWNFQDGWRIPKSTLEECHNCGGRMNNETGFCMDCGTYKGAE